MYPRTGIKGDASKADPNVLVEWHRLQEEHGTLLVALDEAGRQWAKGIELGEAKGRVLVDDVEVASAFRPSWAELTIVLTTLRLPVNTMHAFALNVITAIRPTCVVIIDAYPVPSYISSSPPSHLPPIRYLRTTATSKDSPPVDVEPFYPPNLIQSPAASFLSILESSTHATPATLLLLPSAHIPPPAPRDLQGHSGPDVPEEWEPSILKKLHKAVSTVTGTDSSWLITHTSNRPSGWRTSRRGDIGEGGMYI